MSFSGNSEMYSVLASSMEDSFGIIWLRRLFYFLWPVGRRRRPARCPVSYSNSLNPNFTKPAQKLYIDDI